jgi:hypothetical protein
MSAIGGKADKKSRKADPAGQGHLFAARVFNRRVANFSDCVSDATSFVITLANVIAVNQIAKFLVHNSAWHTNPAVQLNQAAQETMLPLINRHQSDPFSFYSRTKSAALFGQHTGSSSIKLN